MSGEINYRRYSSLSVDTPKFTTDILNNNYFGWYNGGAPTVTVTLRNDNLPPESGIMCKIRSSNSAAGYGSLNTGNILVGPLSVIGDYILEFWMRGEVQPPNTARFYFHTYPTSIYIYTNVFVPTTTWTKYTFRFPADFNISYGSKSRAITQLAYGYFEVHHPVLPADFEVAGFNIRRL